MVYEDVPAERLADLTAIVTGGGGIIGTGLSVRLAREGANVVVAQRSERPAERVVSRIRDLGGQAAFVPTDITQESDIEALVEATIERFGSVNVVVNNAARIQMEWAESMSLQDWEDIVRTNLTGPFRLAQAAYPRMKADGYGRLVNIGAIQRRSPLPGAAAYASSKAGLDGLTRSLANEWSDTQRADITANTVMVGPIYEENDPAKFPEMAIEKVPERVPDEVDDSAATLVGRWGRASDVAALVAFLASPESSFITAAVLPCDGGRLVSRKGKVVDQEERIGE